LVTEASVASMLQLQLTIFNHQWAIMSARCRQQRTKSVTQSI
jgi:hypothetical protein